MAYSIGLHEESDALKKAYTFDISSLTHYFPLARETNYKKELHSKEKRKSLGKRDAVLLFVFSESKQVVEKKM